MKIDNLKYAYKSLIWNYLNFHRVDLGNNIFVFTSRRGGGTWLSECISATRGVTAVIEPTENGWKNPFLNFEKVYMKSLVDRGGVAASDADNEWLVDFIGQILSGELKMGQPWNILDPGFDFITRRLCLKMHVVKHKIDLLAEKFPEVKSVYQIRHPIPQALSAASYESGIWVNSYLEDQQFCDRYVNPVIEVLIGRIAVEGSAIEKYALEWCIENIHPLSLMKNEKSNWLFLTYEQLVTDPVWGARTLSNALELDFDKTLSRMGQASRTTSDQNKRDILSNEDLDHEEKSQRLLGGWTKNVSREEKILVQEILDTFEIDLYSAFEILPNEDSSIFA